ncbi:hypothetical protein Q7P37_009171 [Cladosporium fusiforme]
MANKRAEVMWQDLSNESMEEWAAPTADHAGRELYTSPEDIARRREIAERHAEEAAQNPVVAGWYKLAHEGDMINYMYGQGHREQQQAALTGNSNSTGNNGPTGRRNLTGSTNFTGNSNYSAVASGNRTRDSQVPRHRALSPTQFGTVRITKNEGRTEVAPPARYHQPQPNNTAASREDQAVPAAPRAEALMSHNRAVSHVTTGSRSSRRRGTRKSGPSVPYTGSTVEDMIKANIAKFLQAVESGSLGDNILDLRTPRSYNNLEVYRIMVRAQQYASESNDPSGYEYFDANPEHIVVFHAARKALLNKAFPIAALKGDDRTKRMFGFVGIGKLVQDAEQALEDAKHCTPDLRAAYSKDSKLDVLDKAIEIISNTTNMAVTATDSGDSDAHGPDTPEASSESDTMAQTAADDGASTSREAPLDNDAASVAQPATGIIKYRLFGPDGEYTIENALQLNLPTGVDAELHIRFIRAIPEVGQHLANPLTYDTALVLAMNALVGNPAIDNFLAEVKQYMVQKAGDADAGDDATGDAAAAGAADVGDTDALSEASL